MSSCCSASRAVPVPMSGLVLQVPLSFCFLSLLTGILWMLLTQSFRFISMEKSLSCFKHRLENLPWPLAHCPKGQKFINDMFVKLFLACDPFINVKSPNAALATESLESYFAQLKLTWVPSSTSSLEQSLRSSVATRHRVSRTFGVSHWCHRCAIFMCLQIPANAFL